MFKKAKLVGRVYCSNGFSWVKLMEDIIDKDWECVKIDADIYQGTAWVKTSRLERAIKNMHVDWKAISHKGECYVMKGEYYRNHLATFGQK